MTEVEPTIDNVQPGDVVTLERGTPGEPGHATLAVRATEEVESVAYTRSLGWLRACAMREVWKVTRIDRPAPPIPTTPGERFWARWRSESPREYIGIIGDRFVDLTDGAMWERDMFERNHTVVPAPELDMVLDAVPVPADLIREAERWDALPIESSDVGVGILTRIVRAVREREEES